VTPEAQRIAIAEACGWRKDKRGLGWLTPSGEYSELPDYLNDLNDMHDVVGPHLKDQDFYLRWTEILNSMDPETEGWGTTSAQRAEAFLRTLNLWTDEQ
jgi:hypothetical protein